jgi:hypothetical protein
MNHFVYFVQPIGGGPIKIGCSPTPRGRLTQLMQWSPVPLCILATAPGGFVAEAHIHHRFAADRVRGEWFKPSPNLLDYIRRVATVGRIEGAPPEVPIHGWMTAPKGRRRLAKLLADHGLTQHDLREFTGKSRALISQWCKESVPLRHAETIVEFFASRGVTVAIADLYDTKVPEPGELYGEEHPA